jgi:hypothetical protein
MDRCPTTLDRVTRFAIDPEAFLALARSGRTPHADHRLVAPNSLRSRSLELLLHEVQAGSLEAREALRLHTGLTELKVRLLGDRMSRRTAWDLALEHGWTDLRDAEYLAVTKLQADALVAHGSRLADRADGLVASATLDELFVSP